MKEQGITEDEMKERQRLLELQSDSRRWFSQKEWDRLKHLSNKLFSGFSGKEHQQRTEK